jgi:hypothetical protein
LDLQSEFLCLFDSLNCHTRNPSRSCISRSTSQSHSLSDSISQRASLFTYHLVRAGYSPVPPSRFTLITWKTLVSSPTDYASSGSGSEPRTVTFAELATDQTPLTSSRTCHRHVTIVVGSMYSHSRPFRTDKPLWLDGYLPLVDMDYVSHSDSPLTFRSISI